MQQEPVQTLLSSVVQRAGSRPHLSPEDVLLGCGDTMDLCHRNSACPLSAYRHHSPEHLQIFWVKKNQSHIPHGEILSWIKKMKPHSHKWGSLGLYWCQVMWVPQVPILKPKTH